MIIWMIFRVDDIEDNATLRRGIPVAHNIFGIASTINSANYVYFLSLDKLIKSFPTEVMSDAVSIFTEQLLELHRGQGISYLNCSSRLLDCSSHRPWHLLARFVHLSHRARIHGHDSTQNWWSLWTGRSIDATVQRRQTRLYLYDHIAWNLLPN